jgi:hypothetical protein
LVDKAFPDDMLYLLTTTASSVYRNTFNTTPVAALGRIRMGDDPETLDSSGIQLLSKINVLSQV